MLTDLEARIAGPGVCACGKKSTSQAAATAPRALFVSLICAALISSVVARSVSYAATQKPKEVDASIRKPAWRVNLRDSGYVDDPTLDKMPRLRSLRTLFFVSDTVVAAAFLTRETIPGLQKRDDPNRILPYKLHEVVLDASTGRVLDSREWSSEDVNIGIFSRADGSYVLFTRKNLTLYAPDSQPVKAHELPAAQSTDLFLVSADASPSGKNLLVRYQRASEMVCEWIPTDTMTPTKGNWVWPAWVAVSDQGMAVDDNWLGTAPDHRVRVQMLREPWRILCDSGTMKSCGLPLFLDEQMLLIHTPGELAVVRTDGQLLMRQEVASWNAERLIPLGPIATSAHGQRFAIPVYISTRMSAGLHLNLTEVLARVRVYDMPLHGWVFNLENDTRPMMLGNGTDPHPIEDISGLALSPSGVQMAIEVKGLVQLYRLPAGNESPRIQQ